jgi:hypothetical protein
MRSSLSMHALGIELRLLSPALGLVVFGVGSRVKPLANDWRASGTQVQRNLNDAV